ncbi:hypothetical protein CK215_26855 [Mesorhizobium sp. WSM3864]|uniref:DUF5681 domain-containing protein n=1 Tax=Mesorhizobium sp. WSM3864 TaxID=2029404 RepID=UPI000BAFBBDC|nr:DUF5681 domain-containing protein [Mesorhizobium sp. WSM3864]PBB89546.1 hypothetical protein CK215_26855 [Mesorhizobium sp. WSM3864]
MSTEGGDEKVGYGKPPKKSRFKPGQSGNPKGRPKKSGTVALEILDELKRRITVHENGQERILTKREALAKTIVSGALKKDVRLIQVLMSLVPDQFRIPESSQSVAAAPVSAEEAEILERFVARRLENLTSNQNPSDPPMTEANGSEVTDKGANND